LDKKKCFGRKLKIYQLNFLHSHLKESLVLIPDNETYNDLTNLFKPLFEYLINNKIEIKKLQSLRDTLLPKLMSGEIDVSKINCENTLVNTIFVLIILHFT
jgi:hypothetical protein